MNIIESGAKKGSGLIIIRGKRVWELQKETGLKSYTYGQDRFGSVDSASTCGLKGPGFDSRQGHACTLVAGTSPVGGVQEAADR